MKWDGHKMGAPKWSAPKWITPKSSILWDEITMIQRICSPGRAQMAPINGHLWIANKCSKTP